MTQLTPKPVKINAFQVKEISEAELDRLHEFIKLNPNTKVEFVIWDKNNLSIVTEKGTEMVKVTDWIIDAAKYDTVIAVRTDEFVKKFYLPIDTEVKPPVIPPVVLSPVEITSVPVIEPVIIKTPAIVVTPKPAETPPTIVAPIIPATVKPDIVVPPTA